jgi:hypothetical protein
MDSRSDAWAVSRGRRSVPTAPAADSQLFEDLEEGKKPAEVSGGEST